MVSRYIASLPPPGRKRRKDSGCENRRDPRELADRYEWTFPRTTSCRRPFSSVCGYDTDTVRGPKRAMSIPLSSGMPSMTDIMRESAEGRDEGMERLMDARDRSAEKTVRSRM